MRPANHESLYSTLRTQVESWVQWHRLLILEPGQWGLGDPRGPLLSIIIKLRDSNDQVSETEPTTPEAKQNKQKVKWLQRSDVTSALHTHAHMHGHS